MRGGQSDNWKEEIERAFTNTVKAIRELRILTDQFGESGKDFNEAVSNMLRPVNGPALEVVQELYPDFNRAFRHEDKNLNMVARGLARAYPEKLKALYNKGTKKPLGNQRPLLKGPPIA
jgi:hypothetical protein